MDSFEKIELDTPRSRRIVRHPRPSAAGEGYDATSSGGTNFGPSNPKLVDALSKTAAQFRDADARAADAEIPIDAVTSSGSGLDLHISPQNAILQIARVAGAGGVSENAVRALVATHTEGRQYWQGVVKPTKPTSPAPWYLDHRSPNIGDLRQQRVQAG